MSPFLAQESQDPLMFYSSSFQVLNMKLHSNLSFLNTFC